jgi:HEAT repeat protein
MALSNPQECVPQLFPLLQSDKPTARKNSLELLSRILNGNLEDSIRQMIASNLLPLVGDEAISVRVDIPKLFVSVPPGFIVPPLFRLLSDRDERKRSTASTAVKKILRETTEPSELLQTILDCALARVTAPNSPAAIQAVTRDDQKIAQERALKLIEEWSSESRGTLMLDPLPVLNRLWADPQNGVIVSFVTKSTPLYDRNRLITYLLN